MGFLYWTYILNSVSVDADLDDVLIGWYPQHSAGYAMVTWTSDICAVAPAVHPL